MDSISLLTAISVIIAIIAYIKFRLSSYCQLGAKLPSINTCMSFDLVRKLWVPSEESFSVLKEVLIKPKNLPKDVLGIWLGPILIAQIKNPEDIEQILTSQELLTKSIQYEFFQPWLGAGLLTSAGALWHSRRKLITPAFHFKILEGFVDIINANVEIFVSKLKSKAGNGIFNIDKFVTNLSLDIIAETAMSTKINAQKEANPFSRAIKEITSCVMLRTLTIFYYFNCIYNLSPTGKTESKSREIISATIEEMITSKKKNIKFDNEDNNINDIGEKKRTAFMDLLLASENKGMLDLQGIRDEVNTFMFEGHDTTSSAINFGLQLLSKSPDVQDKIYQELMTVLDGKTTDLEHKDLMALKYLERVIKEILRLYPSVPLIGRKVLKDFKLKSGHILPAGTTILIFIYHLHRNEEVFPEPEKFDPDRFLPENCAQMHPYSYIPFSAGYRNCIGQKFAMLEMKSTLAGVIRNFKINDSGMNVKEEVSLVIRSGKGINISLERR